jgi:hypothetical protein
MIKRKIALSHQSRCIAELERGVNQTRVAGKESAER